MMFFRTVALDHENPGSSHEKCEACEHGRVRLEDESLLLLQKPYRSPSSKWFVPMSEYPDRYYPDYVLGTLCHFSSWEHVGFPIVELQDRLFYRRPLRNPRPLDTCLLRDGSTHQACEI